MSEARWHELNWLKVRWLAYILSFFIPIFGWITFWVFSGRGPRLQVIARGCMIASFIGIIVLIILAAVGVSMFTIPLGVFPGR